MDIEQLPLALRAALRDEGVAKKEDPQKLRDTIDNHGKRLDGLEAKIQAFEARASDEKEQLRGRPSVATSTATASSSASEATFFAVAPLSATAGEKGRQKEVPRASKKRS